jgi:hypothetical protein
MFDAWARLPALSADSPLSCHGLNVLASPDLGDVGLGVAQDTLKPIFFLGKTKGMLRYPVNSI